MKPFTNLFELRPIVINHSFNMNDYLDMAKLKSFINTTHNSSSFILGALGEYAFAVWMREFFLYPDIVPNDDKYITDLNYKKINPNLTNFHIKTIDSSRHSTVTGLINTLTVTGKQNNEPLLHDPIVIENDVIGLVAIDMKSYAVKIYSTIPARIAYRDKMWREPILKHLRGNKLAIYNADIISHDETLSLKSIVSPISEEKDFIPSIESFRK